MTEALIGVVGVLVGALLGGTGKYWLLRRDAWSEARTSGLLLLADVRASRATRDEDRLVRSLRALLDTWGDRREVLAGFRRGNFPSGFRAPEWLELAHHMARLREILEQDGPSTGAQAILRELDAVEASLRRFEADPSVVPYVLRATFRR